MELAKRSILKSKSWRLELKRKPLSAYIHLYVRPKFFVLLFVPAVNDAQIDSLLQTAEQCNHQVHTDVGFKRPDRAYIESLKCAEILRLIAQHREFPYLNTERKSRHIKIRKVSCEASQYIVSGLGH